MSKFVAGERDGMVRWHEVDEAGPDPEFAAIAQGGPMQKTLCGMHFGDDAVNAPSTSFPLCADC